MSQNLIGIAKKYKGKWYVFPEEAEEVIGDKEKYIGPNDDILLADDKYWVEKPKSEWKRNLEITSKMTLGPYSSLKEALEKSESDFFDGYFEYGVSTSDYIGDIKFVLTYEGKEVDEDKSEDENPLERRIQNLESNIQTQQAINLKLLAMITRNTESIEAIAKLTREDDLPNSPNGKGKRYKRTYSEYEKLIDEALSEGDLAKAFEIAFETDLVQNTLKISKTKAFHKSDYLCSNKDREEALKRIKKYYYDQHWSKRKGEYTVADWFCLQPMKPSDIDGEELTEDKTLINELPLMTRRQAWKLINDNLADLGIYLGSFGKYRK